MSINRFAVFGGTTTHRRAGRSWLNAGSQDAQDRRSRLPEWCGGGQVGAGHVALWPYEVLGPISGYLLGTGALPLRPAVPPLVTSPGPTHLCTPSPPSSRWRRNRSTPFARPIVAAPIRAPSSGPTTSMPSEATNLAWRFSSKMEETRFYTCGGCLAVLAALARARLMVVQPTEVRPGDRRTESRETPETPFRCEITALSGVLVGMNRTLGPSGPGQGDGYCTNRPSSPISAISGTWRSPTRAPKVSAGAADTANHCAPITTRKQLKAAVR